VLTEEELEMMRQREELITPKNARISFRPDSYYFTNSFQNSVNKAEFNFTTNKKIEMAITTDQSVSRSTLRRAEEYLDCRNNSSVKIDFENLELEKIKLRWNECVKITNDSFMIEKRKSTRSLKLMIFLLNIFFLFICIFMCGCYVSRKYRESLEIISISRYELVYHSNMKDFINN
jgi:flagellar basal body rod protein FlgB